MCEFVCACVCVRVCVCVCVCVMHVFILVYVWEVMKLYLDVRCVLSEFSFS